MEQREVRIRKRNGRRSEGYNNGRISEKGRGGEVRKNSWYWEGKDSARRRKEKGSWKKGMRTRKEIEWERKCGKEGEMMGRMRMGEEKGRKNAPARVWTVQYCIGL
jgi:hypothetical protein